MDIVFLSEFIFLLKEAGFKTCGDAQAFMNHFGISSKEMYEFLDEILFGNFN